MAFFWKSKAPAAVPRVVIARIEGASERAENVGAGLALGLGFIAMVIAIFVETSAIRLAAWGAIWTGWNILCGIGVLNRRNHFIYTVYREDPPA